MNHPKQVVLWFASPTVTKRDDVQEPNALKFSDARGAPGVGNVQEALVLDAKMADRGVPELLCAIAVAIPV